MNIIIIIIIIIFYIVGLKVGIADRWKVGIIDDLKVGIITEDKTGGLFVFFIDKFIGIEVVFGSEIDWKEIFCGRVTVWIERGNWVIDWILINEEFSDCVFFSDKLFNEVSVE